MHQFLRTRPVSLVATIFVVAAPFWLVGCGSERAGATADRTANSGAPDPEITSAALNNSASQPRPKLRPGAKTVALAAAGDRPYDKTFDDLRFDMKLDEPFRRSMLTKTIEALAGQKVRIRGYILPTPQSHGIKQFVLVRDNKECCFGPGAALYDCILVEMQPPNTADFSIRPVTVDGKFDIHEVVMGGKHLAIYRINAESVH
jgi:hypothetical protein